MHKIVIATRNRGKLAEFSRLLDDLPVEIFSLDEFEDIPEIEETGATFQENAAVKARTVADLTGLIAVADDSGLEVDALNGAPGVYSARFAGEKSSDADNNAKLLKLLQGIPLPKRTARFRSVIAVALPGGECYFAEGKCEGLIGLEPSGANGFGYDPLFFLPSQKLTFAQLSVEEKNKISHRAKAVQGAKRILEQLLAKKNNR
ncbi:XTP/dITP diphosphatase [Zhaonella formicivorans]|uniref:XTP/dITP diphosphatase n=1 Tax=Zhaonella formicivorans TaxID=2528593 RepID=UPI0010D4CB14|nr:XTP/dITP diphosphatase [Zhaonella formicivorans]